MGWPEYPYKKPEEVTPEAMAKSAVRKISFYAKEHGFDLNDFMRNFDEELKKLVRDGKQ